MKNKYCIALLMLIIVFAVGCAVAPPQRLSTPSGKPEITIYGTSKKSVMDLLVATKLKDGFQVRTANDYGLVVSKDIDDFALKVAYGSDYNRTPEARVTYNVVDVGSAVTVFVRSEIVNRPGF